MKNRGRLNGVSKCSVHVYVHANVFVYNTVLFCYNIPFTVDTLF